MDLLEKMGLLTKEDRAGNLTTVQRHLNSDVVRYALGLDARSASKLDVTSSRMMNFGSPP